MKHIFLLLASVLLFSSCAVRPSSISANVEAFSGGAKAPCMKYVIGPGMQNVNLGDLEFREYKSQVDAMLKNYGYEEASDVKDACILIALYYNVSGPKDIPYSYTAPVIGQTGGGTTNYGGQIGGTNFSATSTSDPTFGVVGQSTVSGVNTVYTRTLMIMAGDVAKYHASDKFSSLWKVTVKSTGSVSSLRRIFPYLIKAAQDHIDTNWTGEVSIKMDDEGK